MANNFYTRMKMKERNQYRQGVTDGMKMAFDIVSIALNHEYGFGQERLTRLGMKVQKLVDEINETNDADVTRAHLDKALRQIRGER